MKNLYFIHSIVVVMVMVVVMVVVTSCRPVSTPKPYGYYRIALPEHECARCTMPNAQFMMNKAAFIAQNDPEHPEFFDIDYPSLNATIHCSYLPVQHNLPVLLKDAQEMVYSHAIKASAIPEQEYADDTHRVYGVLYELHGNTATPAQFFLTDSIHHFFRASVYVNTIPNQDSLAPVVDYLMEDIRDMMESFRWNN